jgi:hypothetical protein
MPDWRRAVQPWSPTATSVRSRGRGIAGVWGCPRRASRRHFAAKAAGAPCRAAARHGRLLTGMSGAVPLARTGRIG